MASNNHHKSVREPFGQVAVRKGYVSQEQVQAALKHQSHLVTNGHEHKLIGLVMLDLGFLGTTELINTLKDMSSPIGYVASPEHPRSN